MFTTKEEITQWLKSIDVDKFRINEDLSVDVKGLVNLENQNLTAIPVQFNDVEGSFYCNNNQLTSLLGVPNSVSGSFICDNNLLNNYEHVPRYVGESFYCSGKIDITELKNMEILDDFIHLCHHENDKVEVFSNSYTLVNGKANQYRLKVYSDLFFEAMETAVVIKNKHDLDNLLNSDIKPANKAKL